MPATEGGSRPPANDWRKSLRQAAPLVGLGMQMALTMVLFVGGGYVLDRWLNTSPWLTLAGGVCGIAALFVHLFRLVRELDRRNRERRDAG